MKNILTKKSENYSVKKIDWNKIQIDMKEKLGRDIYESWLKKINFIDEFNTYILISVSTRFIRDWITSRYLDQILQIIKTHKKEINRIELQLMIKKKIKLISKITKVKMKIIKMYHLLKIHFFSIIELTLIRILIIL